MNIYKNLHMLLILVIILAIIVSQVLNRSSTPSPSPSEPGVLKESLTMCDNLSKDKCTNQDQKFLCDYDETRCEECQRKTCADIGHSETACVFANSTETAQQAPVDRSTIPISKQCGTLNPTQNALCIDCSVGGMVNNPAAPMYCSNNSYYTNDTASTSPTTEFKSDGTKAPLAAYFPSCKVAPDGQIQPYVRKPYVFGKDTKTPVNGYMCITNPKLAQNQIDFQCPKDYINITTSYTGVNPPVGSCVPTSSYSLVVKPKSQDDCGGTNSGLKYTSTTQTCDIDSANENNTCQIPTTQIKQGPQPFQKGTDNKCKRIGAIDYVCPDIGYMLQNDTRGQPNGESVCKPLEYKNTPQGLHTTALLEQDIPCYYDKDKTDPTTGKKGACTDCTIGIQDPNSKNIYCFQDAYGNATCQHPEYIPSQLECEAYLSKNCAWKDNKCQPKS